MIPFASAPWPLKAVYCGVLVVGLAVLVLGLICVIALAGLGRLSDHVDPLAIPAWLWYFRADPQVRRWVGVAALCVLGPACVLAIANLRALRPSLHGAARWASQTDLVRAGLRAKRGVVLGRRAGRLLVSAYPEHVLLYAPTRTGKGVGVVIPNLLTWPDSVVVLDVKRENWEATAGFRSAHGQDVRRFDPLDPEGRTARYNPLGHIDRANPAEVIDELQKVGAMLFPIPDNADPFWAEAARTGLIGLGAYVAATPSSPFSLGAIYAELTQGDPRTRLPDMIASRRAAGDPLPGGCVSALSDFCSASENTFASIKQTITARLNLWLSPRVCAATEASDFDLRELRSKRISIYLCVSPADLARVAPLYNLFFQQLVELNTRERPREGQHPVLVLLDEFARLGHAAAIAHGFAYVAGYGLRLLPVLQSPAQLRAEYGADLAEEIVANCGVEVTFAPKELRVAQELSERLGYWTYAARSMSRPSLFSKGWPSTTESGQRRALMLPQELIQLPADKLIILRAGMAPLKATKITYWRERDFASRVRPPPVVAVHPGSRPNDASTIPAPPRPAPPGAPATAAGIELRHAAPDAVVREPGAEGSKPPQPRDRRKAGIEAWVERLIETSAERDLPGPDQGL